MMEKLELRVSVDDANLILEALGDRPFKDVYALITDLQQQAQSQLRTAAPDGDGAWDGAAGGSDGAEPEDSASAPSANGR